MLTFLKMAASFVTLCAAVYAASSDDTKSRGTSGLTRKGRWVVGLAVLGFVVATLIQLFESAEASTKAAELQLRHETLVADMEKVNKGLVQTSDETTKRLETVLGKLERFEEPIELASLRANFGITYSSKDDIFSGYTQRLAKLANEIKGKVNSEGNFDNTKEKYRYWVTNKSRDVHESFLVEPGSPLWPQATTTLEARAADHLRAIILVGDISKRADGKSGSGYRPSMLSFNAGGWVGEPQEKTDPKMPNLPAYLRYDLVTNELTIEASAPLDVTSREGRSEYMSFRDFTDARIAGVFHDNDNAPSQYRLTHFNISFGGKGTLMVKLNKAEPIKTRNAFIGMLVLPPKLTK